jgi:hypothetical protein
VSDVFEASRVREQVLAQQGRSIGRAAGAWADALRAGRTLHTTGDGPRAGLAAYAADLFFRADLAARALPSLDDPDGVLRAVNAFVTVGDVVLVVAHEPRPGLERAVQRARAKGALVLGVLGEPVSAALGSSCDLALLVPSRAGVVTAEVAVSVIHALLQLVSDALGRATTPAVTPQGSPAPPPVIAAPPPRPAALPAPQPAPVLTSAGMAEAVGAGDRRTQELRPEQVVPRLGARISELGVIDEDSDGISGDDYDATDEGTLLAEAIEDLAAPPTDPRATRGRRRVTPSVAQPALGPSPIGGTVRFRCGGCDDPITVDERYSGRRGQCPRCKSEFVIPRPGDPNQRPAVTRAPAPAPQPAPGATSGVRSTGRREQQPVQGSSSGAHATIAQAGQERRRAARITVKDALVRYGKETFPDAAVYVEPLVLEDLSLTGMRVLGRARDYDVGDVLFFVLDFPAFPEPLRLKGEVRRVQKLKSGGGFGAGVKFVQWVGDAESKVRRLIDNAPLRAVRRR